MSVFHISGGVWVENILVDAGIREIRIPELLADNAHAIPRLIGIGNIRVPVELLADNAHAIPRLIGIGSIRIPVELLADNAHAIPMLIIYPYADMPIRIDGVDCVSRWE